MKNFFLKLVPAVIHCVLTFLFLQLMLKSDQSNVTSQLILGFSVLIIISAITTTIISRGRGSILGTTVVIYTLFALIYAYLLLPDDITLKVESLLTKDVVLCTVVLSYSLLSVIIGTMLALMINKITNRIIDRIKQPKDISFM